MTAERVTAAVQLRDAGNITSAIARQLGVGASSVADSLRRDCAVGDGAVETLSGPILDAMAQCTAPVHGHRTSSGAAACPVHGGRSSYSSHRSYDYPSYAAPRPRSGGSSSGGSAGVGSASGGGRSRRLRSGGSASYSATEWRTFEPLARNAEVQAELRPEHRDLFLCHAWDDREGVARAFYDDLCSFDATVWFSETEVSLGKSLLREIDRGLAMSRIGIVLVTPALLASLKAQGVADKELSALLATDRVIPVAYGTNFDALRDVSPLLAARSGLTIGDDLTAHDAAAKIAAAAAAAGDA